MNFVRIHIVVNKDTKPTECLPLFQAAGVRNINENRLLRFGIVSGDIPLEKIPLIEGMTFVESVTPDTEKTVQ